MLRGGLLTFALSNGGSQFIFDLLTYDARGAALLFTVIFPLDENQVTYCNRIMSRSKSTQGSSQT